MSDSETPTTRNPELEPEPTGGGSDEPVPGPAGSASHPDSLQTDSENANNANRELEMREVAEASSGSAVPDEEQESENVTDSPKEPEAFSVPDKEKSEQDKYAEHITYDSDGVAVYTDPESKYQYKWCKIKSEWVAADGSAKVGSEAADPYENEHYRWCHEEKKWIPKESVKETEHYRWCEDTNKWIAKEKPQQEEDKTYSVIDGVHHYTDRDGAVFFWEEDKKAWFPKVDDHFMAVYQLNYGFVDNTSTASSSTKEEEPVKPEPPEEPEDEDPQEQSKTGPRKRKAPPPPPKWFELKPEHNTKVYVSNLPLDVTDEEFGELMSKCGMILKDPKNNKLKCKLYRDADGKIKGDGLCHYIKIESVDLALNILDNYDVRGQKIRVERAEFQLKGEYNPALKPKIRKKEKEKMRKKQEALFDWRPEKMRGERSKHERIVIVRNLFEPALFDREVHLLLEYQNDLREECNKCGTCRRVVIFDRHPDGIAQVTMSDPEEADLVVKLLNGRFFGQRKLAADIWDGKTKYRIEETEADVNNRLGNWAQYLESGDEPEDNKRKSQSETAVNPKQATAPSSAELTSDRKAEDKDDKETEPPEAETGSEEPGEAQKTTAEPLLGEPVESEPSPADEG
ncbi:HIV Tat-specific factor 1 [Uranotaenia lowii]|uniref:HIV Tat-specific factor 1 n=1 Tax=Uranotaenia lowii TaxID=190385 RepID=UPI0024786E8C|nr:HIV Tat-specific factor 1 [Uranotaenia lowii]